jgi:YMGG-like Gly-zipper
MRKPSKILVALGSILLFAGCATRPAGPMVRVLPSPYKPFEVFQQDHYECERWADDSIAGQADRANNRAVGTAVVGTALGAVLGAAAGGGRGAGIGAAAGAVAGTAVGAGQSQDQNYSLQRRYDIAYAQCMYARGNQVPGYGVPQGPPAPPPPPRGRNLPPPPPPPPG